MGGYTPATLVCCNFCFIMAPSTGGLSTRAHAAAALLLFGCCRLGAAPLVVHTTTATQMGTMRPTTSSAGHAWDHTGVHKSLLLMPTCGCVGHECAVLHTANTIA
jgi:hypothetical protein